MQTSNRKLYLLHAFLYLLRKENLHFYGNLLYQVYCVCMHFVIPYTITTILRAQRSMMSLWLYYDWASSDCPATWCYYIWVDCPIILVSHLALQLLFIMHSAYIGIDAWVIIKWNNFHRIKNLCIQTTPNM